MNYKDGKTHGLWTHWYKNGHKELEGTNKDGKYNGLFINYYENGQKWSEVIYKDGKEISSKHWNEDGVLWLND